MEKITVLICDDNIAVHESLSGYLNAAGVRVISVYDGNRALEIMKKEHIDLVILDIMLPRKFGTEICREIRQSSNVPILMLSALGSEDDRILGLELGADDYVTKPFSPREVVARVFTILKRMAPKPVQNVQQIGNLTLFPESYRAEVSGTPLDLTPKEFSVLLHLAKAPGKVLDRDFLLNEVWGYQYYGNTRAVDTIVKRLRTKLAQEDAGCAIVSVYSVGYKLEDISHEA